MTEKNDNIKEIIKEVGALIEEKERTDNPFMAFMTKRLTRKMFETEDNLIKEML